jgi:hypothetical protein
MPARTQIRVSTRDGSITSYSPMARRAVWIREGRERPREQTCPGHRLVAKAIASFVRSQRSKRSRC